MVHENTALFVELTEEQAEIVTGGSGYPDILEDHLNSYYKQNDTATLLQVDQISGPKGSATVQKFANVDHSIDTAAYKDMFAVLY